MAKARTAGDLTILNGPYRSFEWFWSDDAAMPGLDAFERLTRRDQDDFLASIGHWANTPLGIRPAQSRINVESADPIVVAIKSGKQRFTAFKEESGATWVVSAHYIKEGAKRDKTGDRAIEKTKKARERYFIRVRDGTYYERD